MPPKKRWVLIGIACFVALLTYRLLQKPGRPKRAILPVPVRVATAVRRAVPLSLRALGIVQAYRTVTVDPMISGPMTSVDFRQGTVVRKGQLLATIDPRPYQAALAEARAKRAQDIALLAAAQDILKRYDLLIAHHYISAEIVAEQKATVAEDKAILAQDNAAVETARTNLSYTRINAPIAGRTGILAVNAGNIVSPNLAGGIVTIATLQPIYVLFSLPQQDLHDVLTALRARHRNVTAYAGRSRTPIARGRLTVLDNVINEATGTLSVKARFKNPALALWPGAYVHIRLRIQTERNALVIPSVAVRQGPKGAFVYVVSHGPPSQKLKRKHGQKKTGDVTATAVPVQLGFSNQRITVITGGLQVGQQVVIQGGSRLHSHATIRVLPAVSHRRQPTHPAQRLS